VFANPDTPQSCLGVFRHKSGVKYLACQIFVGQGFGILSSISDRRNISFQCYAKAFHCSFRPIALGIAQTVLFFEDSLSKCFLKNTSALANLPFSDY
jgi:hypothetical protein